MVVSQCSGGNAAVSGVEPNAAGGKTEEVVCPLIHSVCMSVCVCW